MTPGRTLLVAFAALSLACVRADRSRASSSEPVAPQPSSVAPPDAELDPAAKVCEHVWALVSAESSAGEAVDGFEDFMEGCVASGEEERRSVGEDEFQRQVACALAADSLPELHACDPDPGPPPASRESARFPEGALVRPLSEVVVHAIYSPDPDAKQLQQTKAARFDRADGTSMVAFCVDTDGSTSDIHTVQKFPEDPLVDQIIRDTVTRWRFRPFVVDGAAVKVCTEKQFLLRFK